MIEFQEFPKLARLTRECSVQEKIDGTNSSVRIVALEGNLPEGPFVAHLGDLAIYAGSRNRFITPDSDNFGFARWVREHAEELAALGVGTHYGEWWGSGIQRRYGLSEKRFSLFNVARWADPALRPPCCHVVPQLYRGVFDTAVIDGVLNELRKRGSIAAPGFMNPEGIVVWHEAARCYFKKTLVGDERGKGQ